MNKEAEKADWKRRQAIKPKPPRVLHESKTFTAVKTETLPKLVARPGRTFMGPEATQRRIDARIARQQVRDKKLIEQANKSVDAMRSSADAIQDGAQAHIAAEIVLGRDTRVLKR